MPSTWTGEPGEFRPPRWSSPDPVSASGEPWPTAGRLVGRFIQRYLVHGEGDALGDPVRIGLPWWYILNRIFTYNPETGQLAYDRVLILMGKGGSKTERIGEIGDAELFGPVAPVRSPRVVLSAAAYGQSIELFSAAKLGILGDPAHGRPGPLADRFREGEHILEDRILLPDGVGRLERTTTVGGTNDGGKPTAHLFDELHEYQTERAERLFIVGNRGIRKRAVIRRTPPELGLPPGVSLWGSLLIGISTPGADRDTLLGRLYEHGLNVARGHDDHGDPVIDPSFLFLSWEADPALDLDDPDQRRQAILQANPMAGYSHPIESIEAAYRDPTVPRAEFVRYNLARWPDAETRWMPAATWDAGIGPVVLDPALPVYVAVSIGGEERQAGAVAAAQLHGEKVVLRVTHFDPPKGEDLVGVTAIENHVAALRETHPARVIIPRRLRPGGPEKKLPTSGPEIVWSGAHFMGSAQRLAADGAAVVEIPISPRSPERLRAAAETLAALADRGDLIHEDDPTLARHVGDIVERASTTGAYILGKAGHQVAGAYAAMAAVHRAMTAPKVVVTEPEYGSFRR